MSQPSWHRGLERVRRDAFFLCRARLHQEKAGAYAEQQQGMYALMRGLAGAFVLSASLHVGWACGLGQPQPSVASVVLLAVFLLTLMRVLAEWRRRAPGQNQAPRWRRDAWFAWVIALLIVLGWAVASRVGRGGVDAGIVLLGIAAGLFLAARWCWSAHSSFRQNFATAVYRDFAALGAPRKAGGQ